MFSLTENYKELVSQIKQFCKDSGRESTEVTLLAVSKTRSADEIRQAYHQGLCCFGENYVQEAREKMLELSDLPIEWHFIGPIQSNKTRQIAESVSWVHSVDRLKIAKRLSEQRPANLPVLNICLQVNIDDEQNKSGCHPDEALKLARDIAKLPNLRLRGLMAIPAPTSDPVKQRQAFKAVAALSEKLKDAGIALDTLSMGMSSDLESAIAEGSTLVRVGTALFGERPAKSVE